MNLESLLDKYQALESSWLIDLSLYDGPTFTNGRIDPWDIIGVLKAPPTCRNLNSGAFQWRFTLYQSETDSINIEFNCYAAKDEPKFQRLNYYTGAIIYVRHIKVFEKTEAGLYAPFGTEEAGRAHYCHRTIYALDPTMKELRQFEKVLLRKRLL